MKQLILIGALALFSLHRAAAAPVQANTQSHAPVKKIDTSARVIDAYVDGDAAIKTAGISDLLVVNVAHYKSFLKSPDNIGQVRLFINCIEIAKSIPMGWCPHGDGADFKFLLERTPDNDKAWNTILGYPTVGTGFFDLPVTVSVGLTGQPCQATNIKDHDAFQFARIYRNWFWFCVVILAVYFAVLFTYAKKTPMLRDAPADLTPLNIVGLDAGNAPYSLGKVQMAFWFSIVVSSYLFIWLITDNYELISTGTLVLIGIGAGTALGAVSINNSKSDGTVKQIQDLQAQQAKLNEANALLGATPGPEIEGKIAYNKFLDTQLSAKINKLIDGLKAGGDTFLNDILTDENGVSFHRLQMVAFTLVLGLVFVYSVWANLTMPDFSATLLTMQGITAGTYLGFKIPEKQG